MSYGYRSRMTKLVVDKIQNDEYLSRIDRTQWYKITDSNQLSFADKFIQLNEDEETKTFLEKSYEKYFMSITSINGLLKRGSMFVFSMQQFRALIDFDSYYDGHKLNNLLDLGAGDGMVTSKMAPFFKNVYATEMSGTMRWRLREKGYRVLGVDNWNNYTLTEQDGKTRIGEQLKYDAISCLNLLDRCETPITLLKDIRDSLVENGLLIVAVVLPFKPYVEYNRDNKPKEDLLSLMNYEEEKNRNNATDYCKSSSIYPTQSSLPSFIPTSTPSTSSSFKSDYKLNKINIQINFLVEGLFKPSGFSLVKFSRLPYLCEGNLSNSYFYMFDYVFVLRKS